MQPLASRQTRTHAGMQRTWYGQGRRLGNRRMHGGAVLPGIITILPHESASSQPRISREMPEMKD